MKYNVRDNKKRRQGWGREDPDRAVREITESDSPPPLLDALGDAIKGGAFNEMKMYQHRSPLVNGLE